MPTIANEASRDRLWLNWAWSIESAEVGTSRIYGNSEGLAVHHPPQNIHTGTENVDRWCFVGSTCFPFQCLFRRGSMHFLICLRIHIVTVCLAEDRDHYYYGADELFRQGVCGWNADVMVFMFTVLLEENCSSWSVLYCPDRLSIYPMCMLLWLHIVHNYTHAFAYLHVCVIMCLWICDHDYTWIIPYNIRIYIYKIQ